MSEGEDETIREPGKMARADDLRGSAAVALAAVFVAGVALAVSQNFVPPLMPVLMKSFDVSLSGASWLVSIGGVVGLICALPAGVVLHRLGPRGAGLIGLAIVLAGAVLAAAVPAFGPMLLSRALVGVGGVLVAVSIPAVVTFWFPPKSRGVPMGLVSCWVPVGFFVAFNGAPRVEAASNWQTAAWIAALILVAGALVYGVFVRAGASRDGEPEESSGWRDFAGHRDIWLHAAAFWCFSSAMVAMFSFYPTFLVEQRGYDLGTASSLTSLVMVAGMPAGVLAGFVANRIGSYKVVYVPCLALTGVLVLLPFRLGGDLLIPISLLAVGFVSSCFPAPAMAAVSEIMGSPRLTGPGMAIITLGANAAVLTGPVLFGWLVDVAGWDAAALSLTPMLLLGALLAWRVRLR